MFITRCCKEEKLLKINILTGVLYNNDKRIEVGYYNDKEIVVKFCLSCKKLISGIDFIYNIIN